MSSSSKKITVGYDYFMGAHMGLVHGPVDALNRIRVADKVVWLGEVTESDSFEIEQPEIFGGKGAEGGIQGTFTFANGEPAQLPSAYLQEQLGEPVPAFRGVTCAILEQMYVSANNPYLKPWAFFLKRTDVTTYSAEQWYVEKAAIPTQCGLDGLLPYSWDIIDQDQGVQNWIPPEGVSSVDVLIVAQGGIGRTAIGIGAVSGGAGGAGGQIKWVTGIPVSGPVPISFVANTYRGWDAIWAVGTPGEIVCLGGEGAISDESQRDAVAFNGGGGSGGTSGVPPNAPSWFGGQGNGGTSGGHGDSYYTNVDNCGASGGGGGGASAPGANAFIAGPGAGGKGVFFGTPDNGITAGLYTSADGLSPMLPEGFGTPQGWFCGGGAGSAVERVFGDSQIFLAPTALGGGAAGTLNNAPDRTGAGGGGIPSNELDENIGGSGFIGVFYRGEISVESFDMNPAHIIRESLTDKEWGMGYSESDIDDDSFIAAADTLYDEGMGISILWQRENTIEAFIQDIVRHIDAALYVDRRTGKFVLKLIRDDYNPGALITLGPDQIERVENYRRPAFGDLVNSVTVIYDDCDDGRRLETPE